jgi:hypothetical protein
MPRRWLYDSIATCQKSSRFASPARPLRCTKDTKNEMPEFTSQIVTPKKMHAAVSSKNSREREF